MSWITEIQNRLVFPGLAAAFIVTCGCDAEQPPINIEPRIAPSTQRLENLKNDLKPPVVVKPSVPAATGSQPAP